MGNRERLVEVQNKLQQDLTFLAAPPFLVHHQEFKIEGPLKDKPPFGNCLFKKGQLHMTRKQLSNAIGLTED